MAAGKVRGSDLLRQRMTVDDLAKFIDVERAGVRLVDFFPKGIPDPDGGWGIWHVEPSALAKLIQSLIKGPNVPVIKVFPKGIPFPDIFEVVFEAGSARQF